jgi:predicted dehydrogenase
MIRVGLVGFGHWGPNLARCLAAHPRARLVAIADRDADRRAAAAERYPQAVAFACAAELLADPMIDAIAIATPAATHFALASSALHAGKHLLVEKPMATREHEAETLVNEAARRRLVLMVDHTFLFTPAVRRLVELVEAGQVGSLRYCDAMRVGLGRVQNDVNVLWDLAVHDLAVLDRLTQETPETVSAHGAGHYSAERVELAFLTLRYPSQFIAHLHVNWLSPVKLRRMLIGGSRSTILWDDLESSEKLKVYGPVDTGAGPAEILRQQQIGARHGDAWSPRLEVREPLADAVEEFLRAIEEGGPGSLADSESGLRVVRLLAAAEASLARNGAPVELAPSPI